MDNLIQFIGRLHPLIVHLPIGIIMLTVCLHLLVWRGRYTAYKGMLSPLWLLSCLSAISASLAGYLLSLDGGYGDAAVNTHMWLGVGLVLVSGAVFAMLQRKIRLNIQVIAVLVVALLLLATGHYGGNLTHGEDYLTEPLFAMLGVGTADSLARKPITNIQEAVVYQDLVAPILEQKCLQCHNETKQKGDLRMDTHEGIMKGGENGGIIVAGNAEKSALYARLMLPEEHDDHMPPEGKPQLTEDEIKLIQWWLSKGQASFTTKVADIEKDKNMKTLLAGFKEASGGAGNQASKADSEIPSVKIPKAKPEVIQQLKKMGVAFTPLTADHVFLSANMVNNPGFNDEDMEQLLKIRDQLLWLDLSGTQITDKGMSKIAEFKYLTRLTLDNTAVTDAGLAPLKGLKALRYLNLYGTAVTDKGLESLAACKNLQHLYLWQTRVTSAAVASFRKKMGAGVQVTAGIELKNN